MNPWEQYGESAKAAGPWSQFQEIKDSQKNKEAIRAKIDADPISQGAASFPTQGNMVMPGVGSVVDKYLSGVKQMAPTGAPTTPAAFHTATPQQLEGAQTASANAAQVSSDTERERRSLNEPLEGTAGGRIGRFGGEVAALAPTTLVPGSASARGASLVGALTGAAQPVTDDESRLVNTGVGSAMAGGASLGINKLANALTGKLAKSEADALLAKDQNAPRDAIISQSRDAGYVIPPASVNPSFLNSTIESIGGKVGTERKASLMNQKATNQLVREELGIPENVPISVKTLEGIRKTAGKAYEDISSISPEASDLVQKLRDARFEAKTQKKYYDRSANPDAQRAALSARQEADGIEQQLEALVTAKGKPDLVQRMREARATIAKTHSVEDAITNTGNVDARALGNSDYLSGKLKQVGDFAEQFPKAAQLPESFGSTNVSAGKALASMLMGGGGGAALGPAGMLASAVPFVAPPAARGLMLSDMVQNAVANRAYSPSTTLMLSKALANNPQLQRLLPSAAVPYVPQMEQ